MVFTNRDRKIAIECGNQLVNKCSVLDKDNKRIQCDLKQSNKDKEELSKHTYQLIEEVKRLSSELDSLIFQITHKDISLNESKIKIKDLQSRIKILETELFSTQNESKEITALQSMKKILEDRLSSTQKDSELESKVNELERLKSEAKSKPVESKTHCSAIIGDLSKYFVRGKNDTKINPKVSDSRSENASASETSINEIRENITPQSQEIPNMVPYLAQPENNISSLIELNSQMGPGPVALPLPAVASTLMSPLSAYICLILFIIMVMWFLRRTWGFDRK
ncbi:16095_t:CDS:2, partial [Entrophospora sp. SA101]